MILEMTASGIKEAKEWLQAKVSKSAKCLACGKHAVSEFKPLEFYAEEQVHSYASTYWLVKFSCPGCGYIMSFECLLTVKPWEFFNND